MRTTHFTTTLVFIMSIIFSAISSRGACPDFVKKEVFETGTDILPDGWVAFSYQNGNSGLFISPLQNHTPTLVSGTENHAVVSVDISDDGRWISYVDATTRKLYLIAKTGGTPIEIPMHYTAGQPASICAGGFLRRSPLGTEIFGTISAKEICAVQVSLGEHSITIGQQRWLLSFINDPADPDNLYTIDYGVGVAYDVSGDQILCRLRSREPQYWSTLDITIPDNGGGTASLDDSYRYSYIQTEEIISGCGHTISHDGTYCVFNPGNAGSLECVPQNANNNSHKGFVVRDFLRVGSQAMTYDQQFDVYARSINWAPERYRNTSDYTVDFNQWNFTNSNQYIAGALLGERSPGYCLWIVAWETNTWIRITPDQKSVMLTYPAVCFTGFTRITPQERSGHGAIRLPPYTGRQPAITNNAFLRERSAPTGRFEIYTCRGERIRQWENRGAIAGSVLFIRTIRQ